jgi:hypothetical protein
LKTKTIVAVVALLLNCSCIAYAQSQDSYRGFHIGMVLSETFAVGGGNLDKAQAGCGNPPKQLSNQERDLLTNVCVKMERTLSGQPTEWEFQKEQLRLAFDEGHLIRVSDFDGVVHLQAAQPQTVALTPAPTIVAPASAQQPPALIPAAPIGAQAPPATDVNGWQLGSPFADFAAKTGVKTGCTKKDCRKIIENAENGKETWFGDRKFKLCFEGARLVEMDLEFSDFAVFLASATAKYGNPVSASQATLQNGYGAQFSAGRARWDMPDGAVIDAFENVTMSQTIGYIRYTNVTVRNAEKARAHASDWHPTEPKL